MSLFSLSMYVFQLLIFIVSIYMMVDADPPINEAAPSIDEVKEAVGKLRGGKAAGICNISAELLKAGSETMICGLHAVLTAV